MARNPPGATTILHAVDKRDATDSTPSYATYVVLPVVLVLLGLLAAGGLVWTLAGGLATQPLNTIYQLSDRALGAAVALVAIGVVVALVLAVVGLYRIVKRRNRHFARDHLLREGLLEYCTWLADTHDVDPEGEHLEEMQRLHDEARMEEQNRSGTLHLLVTLFVLPVWYLYIVLFLQQDVHEHARRQGRFVREAREIFVEAGYDEESVPNVPPIQERSVAISYVLVILLGPIGALLVQYWLFEDPVEHFERQWIHEDALVEAIEAEPTGDQETVLDEPTPPMDEDEGARAAEPPEKEPGEEPDQPAHEPGAGTDEAEPAPEPEMTVWACGDCETKYKVPPQRPVRVTCKNCGNEEILEE